MSAPPLTRLFFSNPAASWISIYPTPPSCGLVVPEARSAIAGRRLDLLWPREGHFVTRRRHRYFAVVVSVVVAGKEWRLFSGKRGCLLSPEIAEVVAC